MLMLRVMKSTKSNKKSWDKKLLAVLVLIAVSVWGAYAWREYQQNRGPVDLVDPVQEGE